MSLRVEHSNIISKKLEDQLMIIKIREGCVKFENDFYRKYCSKKNIINVNDSLTKEEIYCETIAEIIIRIKDKSQKDIKDLGGYVNNCLANATKRYHKKQKQNPIQFVGFGEDWKWPVTSIKDSSKEKELIFDMMYKVLNELKGTCKDILLDKYLNGLTYNEIKEKYNKPTENSAKWYGNDCLKKARKAGEKLYLKHFSNE